MTNSKPYSWKEIVASPAKNTFPVQSMAANAGIDSERDRRYSSYAAFHEDQSSPGDFVDNGGSNDNSGKCLSCKMLKIFFSSALLIFCVTLVIATNVEGNSKAEDSYKIPAPVALLMVLFMILILAMLEGGVVCMIGLKPIDPEVYRESHPIAYKCTSIASLNTKNLSKFIAGKQFLVILMVFGIDALTSVKSGSNTLGMGDTVNGVLAMTFITIVIAQIVPQLIAKECMVEFSNGHFMLFVVYMSLAVEASGLLHIVYLIPIFIEKIGIVEHSQHQQAHDEDTQITIDHHSTIEDNASNSENRYSSPSISRKDWIIFWTKVILSSALFVFSTVVCTAALFDGYTDLGDTISPGLALFVFIAFLLWGLLLSALQVALFAVMKAPRAKLKSRKLAYLNYKAAFRKGNLENFLIGRQVIITGIYFCLAQVTHLDYPDDKTVLNVSSGFQDFLNVNLLGSLVTTIPILSGRILGTILPYTVLSNVFMYPNVYLCKIIGASGAIDSSWPIAKCLMEWPSSRIYVPDSECIPEFAQADLSDHMEESLSSNKSPLLATEVEDSSFSFDDS